MGYVLGKQSKAKLVGVHPDLVRVVERAIRITTQDFSVLEGVRSQQRQFELYGQGRTREQLMAKGIGPRLAKPKMRQVTWTLASNHFKQRDGYGHAVDLVPFPLDWEDLSKFDAISHAMFIASHELGIPIRWGADWDRDGMPRERGETDSPHFELAQGAA